MSHYLVTLCDRCERVTLTGFVPLSDGACSCETCDDVLRVVPSCSYRSSDVEQFSELSQIVADGGVDPEEAEAFAGAAARALAAGAYKSCSDALAVRLPGLLPLQLVTGGNVAGQRASLQMLRTIFEALATHRRSRAVCTSTPSQVAREAQAQGHARS